MWPWRVAQAGEESILCNSGLCSLGSFLPVLCPTNFRNDKVHGLTAENLPGLKPGLGRGVVGALNLLLNFCKDRDHHVNVAGLELAV